MGLKIVGGKFIPGTNEVGAYVAKIYPGGVADQLHGELQEGGRQRVLYTVKIKVENSIVFVKTAYFLFTLTGLIYAFTQQHTNTDTFFGIFHEA